MEKGRRIVRICLLCVIMAAIVVGICYYVSSSPGQDTSEGTLVKCEGEENDGC